MLSRVKEIARDWMVPPGFVSLYRRARNRGAETSAAGTLTAEERALLARNAQFKNAHAGRRCFVIGNGPSLNQQDLGRLAGEVTIVMCYFYRHPILNVWKPTYYCDAEPGNAFKDEKATAEYGAGIAGAGSRAIVVPASVKPVVDKYRHLPAERTFYVKLYGVPEQDAWAQTEIDMTQVMPGAQNTAHLAIMLALYLGCSPIYLIGLDHDHLAHRGAVGHFYSSDEEKAAGVESQDLSKFSYKATMEAVLLTWRLYEFLHAAALQRGVPIYNATDGGFLDVFPRVKYESLFQS